MQTCLVERFDNRMFTDCLFFASKLHKAGDISSKPGNGDFCLPCMRAEHGLNGSGLSIIPSIIVDFLLGITSLPLADNFTYLKPQHYFCAAVFLVSPCNEKLKIMDDPDWFSVGICSPNLFLYIFKHIKHFNSY